MEGAAVETARRHHRHSELTTVAEADDGLVPVGSLLSGFFDELGRLSDVGGDFATGTKFHELAGRYRPAAVEPQAEAEAA
jgi:hypothetical protein